MNPRLLLLSLVLAAPVGARAAPPNVVCILADDLGWSDVSAHPGGTVQTPSIDRLIKQGVELRNFMGWCVCSPTRAMLLTGRHSFRVGSGPEVGGELTAEETTLLEGGTRLVAAMHWPRGGLVGGQAWEGLCGACDLLPTLADMCGLSPPAKNPLDGRNIWPALQARGPSPVESYYWAWRNQDAIRTADWRLHRFFDHFELHDIRQDVGQTNNLADTRPDIVRELTRKMDAWANSLGAALSHQAAPMALDAPAAPEGEVLEITVTVTDKATPSDFIVVPITAVDTFQYATDYIEFDVSVSVDTPAKAAWYYSPFKGEPGASPTILFKKGEGIDQCGRDQSTAPGVRTGPGTWEHRVIGLCGIAPGPLPRHGLVFRGGRPGTRTLTRTLHLDNLRLRRRDGGFVPLWCGGLDTRSRKIADSELFKDVSVRVAKGPTHKR